MHEAATPFNGHHSFVLTSYFSCNSLCTCTTGLSSYDSTVEPLNNVTFGTSYSVHYREVPFFGGYKCVSTIGKRRFGAPNLVLYSGFPLFGVSFSGGSTVLVYITYIKV